MNNNYNNKNISPDWSQCPEIMAVSASSRLDLEQRLFDLKEKCLNSSDIKQTADNCRQSFACHHLFRLLLVVDISENPVEIIDTAITDLAANTNPCGGSKNVFYGGIALPGKLAFVFPGQGSQYPFMGRDLRLCFPEVRNCLANTDACFKASGGATGNLMDFIYPEQSGKDNGKKAVEEALRSTDVAQPAIGAISISMQKVLQRFGIDPDCTCGHSYGELTALFSSGRFDEKTFLSLSVARGKYMSEAAGVGDKGSMIAVKAPLNQIDDLIRSTGLDLVLANRNSPDQGVLSGATDAVVQMKSICKENKIRATILPVAAAFHSKLVKDAAEPFKKKIASVAFSDSQIPVYSNTTGMPYPASAKDAKKILGNHLMNPVNFIEEIQNMYQNGIRIFVEVGPKTVLTGLIKAILKDQNIFAVGVDASSGRRSGIMDLAKTLCMLASIGYPVDLKKWKNS